MIDSGHADELVRSSARPSEASRPAHVFRAPMASDAHHIATLIAACPPLDANSLYCNLLQCTHFARTCVLAEREGRLDGWISGHRPPDQPEAIFVWQVAIHERARGMGLAGAMLDALLARAEVADSRWLKTTVTRSNTASRRMFAKFAQRRSAAMQIEPWFDRDVHLGGAHESEELITIGPF